MTGLEHVLAERWMRWMRAGRRAAAARGRDGWILAINRRELISILATSVVMFAIFTYVFAIDRHAFDDMAGWQRIPLEAASFAMWAFTIYAIVATLVEKVIVSDAGVERHSLSGSRRISWPGLLEANVRVPGDGVLLRGRDGTEVKVSSSLDGLPVLMQYMGRYASPPWVFEAKRGLALDWLGDPALQPK